ncbi:BCCT family transporter [Alkalihalobacterium chitinilyticum]|uniref:BCCT family transporter n=1 Tax=Alkalihalobacterium chitinilyticum TaxID=2980103 RepID=A0ABT5VDZ5_9BACI|nr:BCCT family transporter [Alkalihalobacterium chitinilyticum]MDE5413356.1 BCCT family transporter [Alkalihalobacterium chitinilyticum]
MGNKKKLNSVFNVFTVSAIIVLLMTLWGIFFPDHMEHTMSIGLHFVNDVFGWFYVLATALFVGFCLFLGFGPYQHMKIGKKEDQPEYSYYTWIGMLFAAGMGVGLVFWGVAEPLSHYVNPPEGVEPNTQEAAEKGLLYGVFHWGIHPWAVYGIVALALGFVKYRKGLPGLISSTFYPVIGHRIRGGWGKTIDVVAIVGTTVGIATSFGLSTLQVSGGLSQLFPIQNPEVAQLSIILVVTVIFLISVLSGIDRGMKYLSIGNLTLAAVLLITVIVIGPTLFIMEHFTLTLGTYITQLVPLSFQTTPYTDNDWLGEWTFFYWAWVIAWSPFVGTFIARISKGRSLREFIVGVLFVPALGSVLWFAAFGGTALFQETKEEAGIASTVRDTPESGLFLMLDQLPFGFILSVAALVLISIFFITSANSATYVLGVFSSGGSLNPSKYKLVTWGLLVSAIAASLLMSGGLKGLQATAIVIALPYTILMFIMMVAIYKSLKREGIKEHKVEEKEDW